MKKSFVLLFGMAAALPLYAQTDGSAPADAAPAAADSSSSSGSDAAPAAPAASSDNSAAPAADAAAPAADSSAAPAAGDAAAAPADSGAAASSDAAPAAADAAAAPAEAAPAADSTASSGSDSSSSGSSETASSDSGSAPSETPANPHKLYLGAEYNRLTLSISDPAMATNFGGSTFTTRMYTVRAGIRVFDVMGLELQGGIKGDNGNDPGKAELSSYYGAFFVPTGNVFDLFEVSATLGYNAFTLSRGNASVKFARPAFGVNAELPIREISESLPDLRFTAGYKVYYEEHDSRVYGFHAGLRYDFQL